MARQLFKEFAENEVKPLAQEVDETEHFPEETVAKMQKLGFMGPHGGGLEGTSGTIPLPYPRRIYGTFHRHPAPAAARPGRGTFRRRGSAAVPLRADLGPYPQRTVDGHARKTSARNGRLAVPALGGVEGDACGLLPVLPCGRMDMRGPVPFGYGAFVSAGMSAAFIWRAF